MPINNSYVVPAFFFANEEVLLNLVHMSHQLWQKLRLNVYILRILLFNRFWNVMNDNWNVLDHCILIGAQFFWRARASQPIRIQWSNTFQLSFITFQKRLNSSSTYSYLNFLQILCSMHFGSKTAQVFFLRTQYMILYSSTLYIWTFKAIWL